MKYNIDIQRSKSSRIDSVDFSNIPFGRIFTDHMFIADYYDGQWNDLRIIPYGKISLSPATSAIHYGQSIFEGLKAYKDPAGNVQVFRPGKNWERFNHSARRMAMPEVPEEIFMNALRELVVLDSKWVPKDDVSSLYIRPFMFATDDYIGIKPADTFKFMMFCCPVGAYYTQPVKVLVSDKYVRAAKGGVGAAKASGNYAATMYPLRLAREEGYDQILWLDVHFKHIQEIGTMNVFFQIGDTFVTPSLETETILSGITRDSVMTLLRDRGVRVEERPVTIDEILDAHNRGILYDAFGTGTAATLAPINLIGYKNLKLKIDQESGNRISDEIKEEMEGIKRSTHPDKHNWLMKIEVEVAADH